MTPRCPPPEDVLRSLAVRDREGDAVRAHVASCAQCGQIAAGLERSMREVRKEWGGPVSGERGPDCPSEDTLAGFVEGTLTSEERARVVRHLADCARCSAEVAALVGALGDPGVRAEMERLERGRWARP